MPPPGMQLKLTQGYSLPGIWLPSERMIVDIEQPASIHVGDHHRVNRGTPSIANYDDQVDLWRTIQYHPMLWDMLQVQEAAKAHLVLTP